MGWRAGVHGMAASRAPTGLITSNFLPCRAAGEFEERWVAVVFAG
jgi:hypothetical protein